MCLRYEIHQNSVIGGMKLQVYEQINLFYEAKILNIGSKIFN